MGRGQDIMVATCECKQRKRHTFVSRIWIGIEGKECLGEHGYYFKDFKCMLTILQSIENQL